MKSPFALALFLAASLAHADMVLVQSVNNGTQTSQMTIKVGTDKIRCDVSPMASTITDASTGTVTTLLHAQKAYLVMSATAAKAMIESAAKSAADQPGATPAPTPGPPKATGKTDKINGYNAAEYTYSSGGLTTVFWISSDFPNAQAIKDALEKFRKGSLAQMTQSFSPDMSSIPGVPIRTEVTMNGQKIVTELVSATEQSVDPSEYQVPAAYTQMQMPTMPGQ